MWMLGIEFPSSTRAVLSLYCWVSSLPQHSNFSPHTQHSSCSMTCCLLLWSTNRYLTFTMSKAKLGYLLTYPLCHHLNLSKELHISSRCYAFISPNLTSPYYTQQFRKFCSLCPQVHPDPDLCSPLPLLQMLSKQQPPNWSPAFNLYHPSI